MNELGNQFALLDCLDNLYEAKLLQNMHAKHRNNCVACIGLSTHCDSNAKEEDPIILLCLTKLSLWIRFS